MKINKIQDVLMWLCDKGILSEDEILDIKDKVEDELEK